MTDRLPTHTAAELRAVVRWQGLVTPLLGAQLGLWLLYVAGVGSGLARVDGAAAALLAVVATALGMAVGVAVAVLATKFKEETSGAGLGLLAAVPLVGIGVVVIVYHRANEVLRRHGVRVGPSGPNRADLARLEDADRNVGEDEGW